MTTYRYAVTEPMNPWATAVEIEAADPDQAYRRASLWLFGRRDVGGHPDTTPDMLVHLTLVDPA